MLLYLLVSKWPIQHKFSFFYLFLLDPESGGNVSGRELQRLKKRNVQLEEENNLLKLKIEILLDMVRIEQLRLSPYILNNLKDAIYCTSIFIHWGRNV